MRKRRTSFQLHIGDFGQVLTVSGAAMGCTDPASVSVRPAIGWPVLPGILSLVLGGLSPAGSADSFEGQRAV